MKSDRYLLTLGVGLAIASVLNGARCDIGVVLFAAHAAEETPPETLAAHIRRQGYRCDEPLSAVSDAERSKPDEAVWVLKCANVTYRLTLIPDMAWKVEHIDEPAGEIARRLADLPVEQPTRLYFVVNLITAKALGLIIPPLLIVADIERSARFYETVFGGRILSRGDGSGTRSGIPIGDLPCCRRPHHCEPLGEVLMKLLPEGL